MSSSPTEFNVALREFCEIADFGWQGGDLKKLHRTDAAKSFVEAHYEYARTNKIDIDLPGAVILHYLGDAIKLYQIRTDEYAGQFHLLFNSESQHIRGLYQAAEIVRSFKLEEDPAYLAAVRIEDLLDVLTATIPSSDPAIYVTGYSTGSRFPWGRGVIVREYGEHENYAGGRSGTAIYEVKSSEVFGHMSEGNVLRHVEYSNPFPVDMVAVSATGQTRQFNYYDPNKLKDKSLLSLNTDQIDNRDIQARLQKLYKRREQVYGRFLGYGVGAHFGKKTVAFFERELLPWLEKEFPPLIQINRAGAQASLQSKASLGAN